MAFTGSNHSVTARGDAGAHPHVPQKFCAFRDALRKALIARTTTYEGAIRDARLRGNDAETRELIETLEGLHAREQHPRVAENRDVRTIVINRALRRSDRRLLTWDEISRL
jgi:ribosomal protein L4